MRFSGKFARVTLEGKLISEISGYTFDGGESTVIATTAFGAIAVAKDFGDQDHGSIEITGQYDPNVEILGVDQVTNGSFTGNADGWTLNGNWVYNANAVDHSPGSILAMIQDTDTDFIRNTTYRFSFVVTNRTAGSFTFNIQGAGQSAAQTASNTVDYFYDGVGAQLITFTPTTDFDGTLDDIVVTQVTSGQAILQSAFANQSSIPATASDFGFRFYVDSTSYWTPDVTNDPNNAAAKVTKAAAIDMQRSGLATASYTVEKSGVWSLV